MRKNIFGMFGTIHILIFLFLSFPFPINALEGTASGPCMPPHDAPTVGSYHGGDQNLQTYAAQSGRTVTRICMATRLSNGKVDHSSFYANYSSACYQVTGVGSATVTVKRVAETYQVPEWQTGPEAGKCAPLVHLDIFLSSEPASTPQSSPSPATPTPSPNTAGQTSTTPTPSAAAAAFKTTTKTTGVAATTGDESDVEALSQVLGEADAASESAEAGEKLLQNSSNSTFFQKWWLAGLLVLLILLISYILRRRR